MSHQKVFLWPRVFWDQKSKAFFNPSTVQVDLYDVPTRLKFNRRDIISISGAPTGSTVVGSGVGGVLQLTIVNDTFFSEPYRMSLMTDGDGSKVALIQFIKIHPSYQRNGITSRILICSARAAHRLGVRQLRLHGLAVSPDESPASDSWSGAPTALTLGCDAVLSSDVRDELPPAMKHARNLREVVEHPDGAAWWNAKPRTLEFFFDPDPQSKCMQILGAYIRRRKIRISQ